jgi:hypothetical protein
MLFNPTAHSVRKLPWIYVMATAFFGLFGPGSVVSYWYVYGALVAAAVMYATFLSAVCESYLAFAAGLFVAATLLLLVLFCWGIYLFLNNSPGVLGGYATGFPVTLFGLALASIFLVAHRPSAPVGLTIRGARVAYQIQPRVERHPFLLPALTGLIALLSNILAASGSDFLRDAVAVSVGMICCGAFVFYGRNEIKIISILLRKRREIDQPFTFWYLEDIKAMRKVWWLSRLVNRVCKV